MADKQQRTPVKFEDNKPITATFDFDPGTAKSFEQDSKYTETGKVTKYLVAVNGNQIIFATEALYNKIKGFNKDDKVTINFSEKRWIVNSESGASPSFEKEYQDRSIMAALTQIMSDLEAIKKYIYEDKEDTKKEYPTDEESVDF